MSYPTELVDEIIKLRAENAALAEQNAKMRGVLEFYMENGIREPLYYKAKEALALPDLSTPAVNRIKAEAYRECAEICKESAQQFERMARGDYGPTYDFQAIAATELSEEIRAKADELEGKKCASQTSN